MCLVLLARNVSLLVLLVAIATQRQFWPHKKSLGRQNFFSKTACNQPFYHHNQWWVRMTCLSSWRCVQSDLRKNFPEQPLQSMEMKPASTLVSLQKLLFASASQFNPQWWRLRGMIWLRILDSPLNWWGCWGLLREIWAHCEQLEYSSHCGKRLFSVHIYDIFNLK